MKKIDKREQKLVKKSWVIFIITLIAVLFGGLLIHPHGKFGIDGAWWFNPAFGFIACVAIILVSKALGYLLKRGENYYKGDEC